eukprot:1012548-Prymnesium_polylepis.1
MPAEVRRSTTTLDPRCTRRWRLAATAGGRRRGSAVGWSALEEWHHPDGDLHAAGAAAGAADAGPREWWHKRRVSVKEQLGEELVHRACLAILDIRSCQCAPASVPSRALVLAVARWREPETLPADEAERVGAYLRALREHSIAALAAAIHRLLSGYAQRASGLDRFDRSASWLTPSCSVQLSDWRMCSELYCAKLFLDRATETRSMSDAEGVLRRLSDLQRACSRADWAAAFGVDL